MPGRLHDMQIDGLRASPLTSRMASGGAGSGMEQAGPGGRVRRSGREQAAGACPLTNWKDRLDQFETWNFPGQHFMHAVLSTCSSNLYQV